MTLRQKTIATLITGILTLPTALANHPPVRVINASNSPIFLHVGGYAPASRLAPGQTKTFQYPFKVRLPSNRSKIIKSNLLVATAGGHWTTTTYGYTYLSKPQMLVCLNYQQHDATRPWKIKHAYGFDKGCQMKGYKQPWHNPIKK